MVILAMPSLDNRPIYGCSERSFTRSENNLLSYLLYVLEWVLLNQYYNISFLSDCADSVQIILLLTIGQFHYQLTFQLNFFHYYILPWLLLLFVFDFLTAHKYLYQVQCLISF